MAGAKPSAALAATLTPTSESYAMRDRPPCLPHGARYADRCDPCVRHSRRRAAAPANRVKTATSCGKPSVSCHLRPAHRSRAPGESSRADRNKRRQHNVLRNSCALRHFALCLEGHAAENSPSLDRRHGSSILPLCPFRWIPRRNNNTRPGPPPAVGLLLIAPRQVIQIVGAHDHPEDIV